MRFSGSGFAAALGLRDGSRRPGAEGSAGSRGWSGASGAAAAGAARSPGAAAGSAGVGAFKTAMRSLGIITTNQMARPQRHLNDEETSRLDAILRDTGLLG